MSSQATQSSSVALLDRCPGVLAAHPAREVEGGACLPLSVRPPWQQEVPICWERKDKGRLTTERPQSISVNTVAVQPSTQRFTFLLNHSGKLETLLLA